MQADFTQENTQTFSSPQCLGAGIAQAIQLQSLQIVTTKFNCELTCVCHSVPYKKTRQSQEGL